MTNKQERGAIMVEVLAVLALIGVMGPMLYKQVLSRNQEISNVNIAAEMRAIKEAMSAAIAADSAVLQKLCGTGGVDLTACTAGDATFQAAVEEFLPIGMDGILDSDYGYTVKLYSQEAVLQNGQKYPIFVGIVAGADLASDWSFKRAARIANLIGTDGGISQNGILVGTGGSWQLDEAHIVPRLKTELQINIADYPLVVATTAMDTFDPDLGITDPNAVFLPNELGLKDLHAWNYFSVGEGNDNCVDIRHGTKEGDAAASDYIRRKGEDSCDPLFWVDGGSMDLKQKGNVYVKNNLYIAQESFAFETKGKKDKDNNDVDYNRFIVYATDGSKKLEINDRGQIITKDGDSMCAGTKNADGTCPDDKKYNYGLDPAKTSVLNDIRLGSRGGARLSDILPNYISKGIYQISSTTTHPVSYAVPKPTCPEEYAAAVIVTPIKWKSSAVTKITVPTGATSLSSSNITQNRQHFAIDVTQSQNNNRITGTSNWNVKLGYKINATDASFQSLSDFKNGEIQALAQTYCVYVPTDTSYNPNGLTDSLPDDKKIPDNLKK